MTPDEAVASCFVFVFLRIQCEFAVTASNSVNTVRMIFFLGVVCAISGPFRTYMESAHRMRQAMTTGV